MKKATYLGEPVYEVGYEFSFGFKDKKMAKQFEEYLKDEFEENIRNCFTVYRAARKAAIVVHRDNMVTIEERVNEKDLRKF